MSDNTRGGLITRAELTSRSLRISRCRVSWSCLSLRLGVEHRISDDQGQRNGVRAGARVRELVLGQLKRALVGPHAAVGRRDPLGQAGRQVVERDGEWRQVEGRRWLGRVLPELEGGAGAYQSASAGERVESSSGRTRMYSGRMCGVEAAPPVVGRFASGSSEPWPTPALRATSCEFQPRDVRRGSNGQQTDESSG